MDIKKLPWPAKGKKAFVEGTDMRDFQVPQFNDHSPHGRAFMDAADALMETYQSMRTYRDDFFFPIAYLYRHGLELLLKDLIRIGLFLEFFKVEDVEEMLAGHGLAPLWNKARKLIEYRFPVSDRSPIIGTETVINQFHQEDPSGQRLRYLFSKDGAWHDHPTLPKKVDVETMRERMQGVHTFLSCCANSFDDEIQYRLTWQQEQCQE